MLIGIGIDLVNAGTMGSLIERFGAPFLTKTFSQKERENACTKKDLSMYYASRFAGKEAVFKALHCDSLDFREIEIRNEPDGSPVAILPDSFREPNLRIHLSLTTEDSYAAAFSVAERL